MASRRVARGAISAADIRSVSMGYLFFVTVSARHARGDVRSRCGCPRTSGEALASIRPRIASAQSVRVRRGSKRSSPARLFEARVASRAVALLAIDANCRPSLAQHPAAAAVIPAQLPPSCASEAQPSSPYRRERMRRSAEAEDGVLQRRTADCEPDHACHHAAVVNSSRESYR